MKIKAKFKGTDSLGYENGKNYILSFLTTGTELGSDARIWIRDVDFDPKICEYESLKSFLNNWQVF